MKSKYIFPCIMALAVASGCVKEQGDEAYTITRTISDGSKDTARTVISEVNGYMYGKAIKDSVVENTFEVVLNDKMISDLNCYVKLKSEFLELDLDRNAIKKVGYVYSKSDSKPLVGSRNCYEFSQNKVSYNASDSTKSEITFTGRCDNLDFNNNYYMRSYAISTKGDTLYNPFVAQFTTTLPHDVWFQRNDAPAGLGFRYNCFHCTNDGVTYIYGGQNGANYYNDLWSYDKTNDTWQQVASANDITGLCAGTEKRSNGAMIAYENGADILLFIIGGEISTDTYTDKILFYSTKNNRYCKKPDHPNYNTRVDYYEDGKKQYYYTEKDQPTEIELKDQDGNPILDENGDPKTYTQHTDSAVVQVTAAREYIEPLPQPMAGMVGFSVVSTGGLKRQYIGLGKTQDGGVLNDFYAYNKEYDIMNFMHPEYSAVTWDGMGSISTGRGNNIGLYQAVAEVCGSTVMVGTGETSDGVSNNFYLLTFGTTGEITSNQIASPSDSDYPNLKFKPRANAASFYLEYTEDGVPYNRFYVGTGRTGKEKDASYDLLKDFWCYDFNQKRWFALADCSNICREGAVGFALERTDDRFAKDQGVKARGIFSFGFGYSLDPSDRNVLRDNWEYLP